MIYPTTSVAAPVDLKKSVQPVIPIHSRMAVALFHEEGATINGSLASSLSTRRPRAHRWGRSLPVFLLDLSRRKRINGMILFV